VVSVTNGWFDYASYMQEAGKEEEGVAVLNSGLEALPRRY
jgi:hypothetical protein